MDLSKWMTLEQIQSYMLAMDWEGARDLSRLRNQVSHLVRVGAMPRPVRVRRTDGKPGTIGVYPSDSVLLLQEHLSRREEKGRTRQRLPKKQDEVAQPQRLFSVSFWIPEPLADQIDRHILAGYPLSRQVLIGSRLLEGADDEVRFAAIKDWLNAQGEEARRRAGDERWQYASSLALTGYLLDHLNDLTAQLKVSEEQILREVRFEFAVVEGHVHIKNAFVKAQDGQWQAMEVRDV